MTESNTNDRRFWMVVTKITNIETGITSFDVAKDSTGSAIFSDAKAADSIATEYADMLSGDDVYVVEAISKYSLPEPRVVKQNLHIPPLTPRGESNE